MESKPKLALVVSLIVIVGIPIFFLVVSFITGNLNYFYFSLVPAGVAGVIGVVQSAIQLNKLKKDK